MRIVIVALGVWLAQLLQPATAEPRVALVIGNGSYETPGWKLANPANDARLVATALEAVDFDVELGIDLTEEQMEQAFFDLYQRLDTAGEDAVGVLYFAGHGVESKGENYLIPVDAALTYEQQLRAQAPRLNLALEYMSDAGNRLNFVMLDACRNNPLPSSARGADGGLGNVAQSEGLLVSFATAPGSTATDGAGDNSPYSKALAEYMQRDGLVAETMFKRVATRVRDVTGGLQNPFMNSGLTGDDFYFGASTAPTTQFASAAVAEAPSAQRDLGKGPRVKEIWSVDTGSPILAGIWAPDSLRTHVLSEKNETNVQTYRGVGRSDQGKSIGFSGARLTSVAMDSDGNLIVGGEDGVARVFSTDCQRSYNCAIELTGHTAAISSVAWGPSGRLVMTGSADGTAKIWSVPDRKMILDIDDHESAVTAVEWAKWSGRTDNLDHLVLTGTEGGDVKVWEFETYLEEDDSTSVEFLEETATLQRHRKAVTSIASEDEYLILTGSLDGTALIWTKGDSELLQDVPDDEYAVLQTLKAHTGAILSVDFHFDLRDGLAMITGSSDGTARSWWWNEETNDLESDLMAGHDGAVTSVSISPDNGLFLTTGEDGTLRYWIINRE